MKQKKPTYLLLIIGLLTFFSSSLFSQERGDLPGEEISTNFTTDIQESEIVYPENVTIPNSPMEYGPNHYNYNLTNTSTSSDKAIIPHSGSFNQSVDGSIEMWIYANSINQVSDLISKGATSTVQFHFGIAHTHGDRLYFRIGTHPIINDDGDSIRLNVWTHVAVTWYISGGNATVDFYVNGAHSGTQKVEASTWVSNTDDVWIGGCQPWPGENFDGKIDEVRIWDPDLTQNQIATNRFIGIGTLTDANTSSAITGGDKYTGLVASWTFNESSGVYDYIGGHNGTYNGAATNEQSIPGQPIPYNLAMYFPGSDSNYIPINDNGIFTQNGAGSLEAWVRLDDVTNFHNIISQDGDNLNWYISTNDYQIFVIGGTNFMNTDGIKLVPDVWTHVAVTWAGSGGNFIVNFYVNGHKSGSTITQAATWSINSEPFLIGCNILYPANNLRGYLDELRLWNPELTESEIQYNMNVSATRLLGNSNLEACWNFEGHLRNITSTTGVDGTLNNGGVNNCRFSGFSNETTSGTFSTGFTSHPTVLYYGSLEDDFRKSFPNAVLKDAPVIDSIYVPTSGAVTNVELFVHIQHDYTMDVDITLTAPNGTSKNVASDQVGMHNGYLTVFEDGASNLMNNDPQPFKAPFSNHVQPEVLFGNMGGTDKQGWWKISVDDDKSSSDTGRFISWGLCINNSTEVEDIVQGPYEYKLSQNYPNPFNPTTKIEYSIANAGLVELKIYNILGEEITTLVNEIQNPGKHTIEFSGIDLSSGVYFYRITSGKFTDVKKMILIK